MKTIYSLFFIFFCINLFAQAPQKFSYQAVIRSNSNELVTDKIVTMKISILQGSVSGKVIFSELQTPTTNTNGLVSIEIGSGTVQEGSMAGIDWANGPYFIKTETDPKGGTEYTINGTSQLLSVPFALYAQKAGNGFSGNYNDLTGKPDFSKWDKDSTDNVMLVGNQTIAGNKTFTGITTVPTPVNASDAATKAYVDILLEKIKRLESLTGVEEPVIDIDGNTYKTIRIGTQVWMAENLKTTKFKNDTTIPLVTDNTAWTALSTPGYCWYNNDETTYKATYGALYNWYCVSTGNLCPKGWHVPSNDEWTTLIDYLGGTSVAGGKLKETGTTHWLAPNNGATNETGFTALPGGYRYVNAKFSNINSQGNWWTATELNSTNVWYLYMNNGDSSISSYNYNMRVGFYVRCIRD